MKYIHEATEEHVYTSPAVYQKRENHTVMLFVKREIEVSNARMADNHSGNLCSHRLWAVTTVILVIF